MQLHISVTSSEFADSEEIALIASALQALSGKAPAGTTIVNNLTPVETPVTPTEGKETGNLDTGGIPKDPEPEPEPEKPKRKRRTQAQIKADEAAAAEADKADAEKAAAGDPEPEEPQETEQVDLGLDTEPDEVEPAEADEPSSDVDDSGMDLEGLVKLGKSYLEGDGITEGDPQEIRSIIAARGYQRLSEVPAKEIPAVAAELRALIAG